MSLTIPKPGTAYEQPRARYPDAEGFVERDGVRVFYEVYGEGERTVLLLPTWSVVHSRSWKAQIPYLARHFRVVTFDGRGNGRSDRPAGLESYLEHQFAADSLAVLDATGTERATLVGISCGALWGTILAADHPERVDGIVHIGPSVGLAPNHPERDVWAFDEPLATDEGWAKYNSHFWSRDYRGFLEFFFRECVSEPHSTKQIEDAVGWGLGTDPATLADTTRALSLCSVETFREICSRVRCPVLVIHGDADRIRPHAQGAALAEVTGGTLVTLEGVGHLPTVRDPVAVNLLLRDFVDPHATRAKRRTAAKAKRALLVSSPIGLGHAWRDVAIARELRRLVPGLEVDWLAQPPVTTLLEVCGETIHPASAELASEAAGVDAEAAEHELHAFQMLRRFDEIFTANFMVFHDLVREEAFDVWIADEAWELDYYLHEHPELKTAPYVWLTDFVGVLPMPDGGEREAFLTADWNAQMVDHIARHPHVRDRSIFIGDPEDLVPESLGPGLPSIRDWTEPRFDFSGYVTGFDASAIADRAALRAEFGYGPDEQVCIVATGGSAVGVHLLERAVAAFPEAKRRVPGLRMIVVAGPRIDPSSLPRADGLETAGYVHELHRQLAACDIAITHGGLSTTMELTAAGRPFLFFPLRQHFEQNHHVAHRLARHGAGRRMSYDTDGPEEIAAALAEELGRETSYRPVERHGATRAAQAIAALL